jgi:hypothetical protein
MTELRGIGQGLRTFLRTFSAVWRETGRRTVVIYLAICCTWEPFVAICAPDSTVTRAPHFSSHLAWSLALIVGSGLSMLLATAIYGGIRRAEERKAPNNARFLVQLFNATREGDAFLGDLQERFGNILAEHSATRAWLWYWFQVIVSLRPIAWAAMKRVTGAAAAYEAIRRVIR